MFFNPISVIFLILFFLLLFGLFFFAQIGVLTLAFAKIGINPQYMFALLFFTLVGSGVNIPIKRIKEEKLCDEEHVRFYGMRYRVPSFRDPCTTVLAVNLGGAVIPVLISLYVLAKCPVPIQALLATGIMVVVMNKLARPVKGIGIGVPVLTPPLIAAMLGLLLAPGNAPPVAYVAGTMGTLIGADLLNLKKIAGLGAPVASIGGAGTFDGIFLAGIIAVLLA
jgi:uncharacterized membrane protein